MLAAGYSTGDETAKIRKNNEMPQMPLCKHCMHRSILKFHVNWRIAIDHAINEEHCRLRHVSHSSRLSAVSMCTLVVQNMALLCVCQIVERIRFSRFLDPNKRTVSLPWSS